MPSFRDNLSPVARIKGTGNAIWTSSRATAQLPRCAQTETSPTVQPGDIDATDRANGRFPCRPRGLSFNEVARSSPIVARQAGAPTAIPCEDRSRPSHRPRHVRTRWPRDARHDGAKERGGKRRATIPGGHTPNHPRAWCERKVLKACGPRLKTTAVRGRVLTLAVRTHTARRFAALRGVSSGFRLAMVVAVVCVSALRRCAYRALCSTMRRPSRAGPLGWGLRRVGSVVGDVEIATGVFGGRLPRPEPASGRR